MLDIKYVRENQEAVAEAMRNRTTSRRSRHRAVTSLNSLRYAPATPSRARGTRGRA